VTSGIDFTFAADVTSVLKGTKDVEGALDKVASSLDSVDGAPLERELSSTMDNVARDSKDAADKLETKFSDAFKAVKSDAKTMGDTVGREMGDAGGKAGEAAQSFKEEATQNFAEVASSFSGDMSQAADGVQGILGGLASAIPGPVGVLSGLLAGIGGAMLSSFIANSEASKQKIQDMFDDMASNASSFVSNDYFGSAVKAIVDDTKQYANAQDIAAQSGLSLGTVLRGMAGEADAAQRVTQALTDRTKEIGTASADAANGVFVMSDAERDLFDKQQNLSNATKAWNDITVTNQASMDTAQSKYYSYQQAMDGLSGAFDNTTAAAQRVSQGIGSIPQSATVKITVDDSEVQAWLRKPKQFTAGVVVRPGQVQVV
jgi:hypothetical protein